MRPRKLDIQSVEGELAKLGGWTLREDGKAIVKTFKFKNFIEAFGFMTQCALAAEKLDHHPEWSNVYSKVDVILSTHDAGGLTELDFKLAQLMDSVVAND
jgi:4a-hydroxytetrahydrobiopterin dehydratase